MTIATAALFVVAIPNVLIGLTVLLRNVKNATNISFMSFVAFVALWAIGLAAFTSTDSEAAALYWSKLYYIAAIGIGVSLLLFCRNYLSYHQLSLTRTILYILPAFILSILIAVVPEFLTSTVMQDGSSREVLLNRSH